MADYPDWSRLVHLVGSDIKVPIDVQAQYVTLDINILSTTADIDVNINAQNVELDIDITAQHIGVYLQPEWAAKEGDDKNFYAYGTVVTWGQERHVDYAVPHGSTLYITGMSFLIIVETNTDYDHFLYFFGELLEVGGAGIIAVLGGVGGGGMSFSKPVVINEDLTMRLTITNRANLSCYVQATCWGFEI